jgi:hypothetical protein
MLKWICVAPASAWHLISGASQQRKQKTFVGVEEECGG